MKIIVDANVVFSGILNTNGKIGDLLIVRIYPIVNEIFFPSPSSINRYKVDN